MMACFILFPLIMKKRRPSFGNYRGLTGEKWAESTEKFCGFIFIRETPILLRLLKQTRTCLFGQVVTKSLHDKRPAQLAIWSFVQLSNHKKMFDKIHARFLKMISNCYWRYVSP